MNAVADANGPAVEKLLALIDAPDRASVRYADIRGAQIEAANERLQSRRDAIKLVGHRAQQGKVEEVRRPEDLVPLLLAHTSYKSYPEAWMTGGQWGRMGKWLDTIVTRRVPNVDLDGVDGIDAWIERLADAGVYLSCSSGTTGKCSIIPSSDVDRALAKRGTVASFWWKTGIAPPDRRFKMVSTAPMAKTFRSQDSRDALAQNYGDVDTYTFPGAPITVGQISKMVALRRRIAEGSARPGEIAEFEATSAARQQDLDAAIDIAARRIVDNRERPLIISGLTAGMFKVAEQVRAMGFAGADFHPDNCINGGGGLKGAVLPPDYRQFILETFNVRPERNCQIYTMQELNSTLSRCIADRYHAPPTLIVLPLDEGGDTLLATEGEVEGRAGFFDVAIDGRWGGLITGDKVHVDFGRCACGQDGPTIGSDITRYSETPGGDKITCAGTIEAYVRGVS
jgi:hypothetical protein